MIPRASSSLVLGTVQFGLPYGVANKTGRPDQAMVTDIVRTAWGKGIKEFDTAQDYGISENMLGIAFAKLGISAEAKVISKINPELNHCDPQVMTKALDASLEKLGVPCLFGLMLHKEDLLCQWANGLRDILQGFITLGKVKKLGVSVYSPDRALEALSMKGLDMIQVPSNILDRRFERQGVFELAAKKNRQVYIRSVFLQGLILMEPEDLPNHMSFARPVLNKIKSLSHELNLTRHELALGYLKEKVPEAKLIVGVDTPEQLIENVECWERKPVANLISLVSEYFDHVDEKILNPTLWSS
jgi:aryl-alcohol dehydrogenase-like predicted oxidoreductase